MGMGVFAAGSLVGSDRARYLGLRSAAEVALSAGALRAAENLAQELLDTGRGEPDDWYAGNAVHFGHQILGRVHLRRGDFDAAEAELLESGRTPGSPQLHSFGPNMALAVELLGVERHQAVLEFLDLCRTFWCRDGHPEKETRLNQWIDQVSASDTPDFGPNLIY